MSLNDTPSGNRVHIGIFGRRNAGKSSLVNAITGQQMSVVSDVKGTTTDPVSKCMELLPLGPVVIIDTPGLDDEGELGAMRMEKTRQVLNKTDIAVLVIDGTIGVEKIEQSCIQAFKDRSIPYVLVVNKMDLCETTEYTEDVIKLCAKSGDGVEVLKERLACMEKISEVQFPLVRDLLQTMDMVVLVVPIDESAPKGRLILPQQQVIRDVLETGAISVVVKDTEYKELLETMQQPPKLVITDSQVFERIAKDTPEEIPLTSFSILMARKKGFLRSAVNGVEVLETLQSGEKVLIAEGCTHHRQCADIGTVKLPQWIRDYTKTEPEFVYCSGNEFPEDLSDYRLVIHCGGCMLNEREMLYRMNCARQQKVPFTNYGIAIAKMHLILERSLYALKYRF